MTSPTIRTPAPSTSQGLVNRRVLAVAIDMGTVLVLLLLLRRLFGPGLLPFAVVGLLTTAVYGVVQGETGTCPGKAIMGLKLVNEQGVAPGTATALIRLAAWAVDGLPCLGMLGFILIWLTPSHQRIGDTITRTFVVPIDPPAGTAGTPVAPATRRRYGRATPPAGQETPMAPAATSRSDTEDVPRAQATRDDDPVGADGADETHHAGDDARPDARSAFDPIWDPKVGAYVQWDPIDRRWMRYDEVLDSWSPVEAA